MTSTAVVTNAVRRWNRYPDYGPASAEWLLELPAHWCAKRLRYLAVPSSRRLFQKPDDTTYIGLEQIEPKTGKLLLNNPVETVESSMGAFEAGDILFGKLRPYLAKVASPTFPGVCSTELLVYRPAHEIDGRYLKYQMLVGDFIDFVNALSYGTKMPRVSEEQMGEVCLAIPPLTEQRQIVAFLDRETSLIDALITQKECLIALLQDKRQAMISHAVTQGLNEGVQLVETACAWVGAIPTHWSVLPFRRIASRVDVGIAEAAAHAYRDSGVPIIRSTNVRRNSLDTDDMYYIDPGFAEKNRSKYLNAGDLVTTRTGANLGMTALIPEEYGRSQCFTLLIATLRRPHVPLFFSYWMNSIPNQFYFEVEGWGAGQHNLSVPVIQQMPVPVPPAGEQVMIADFISDFDSRSAVLCKRIDEGIRRLQEYRTALISAAVTGQIDVRGEVRHE